MGQSRLVLISCCAILAITLAACNQELPRLFISPLSPTLATFDSPVSGQGTPVVPPTATPTIRASDTPDPQNTTLIIAGVVIGDDGHEIVQIKNIGTGKLDISNYSLYNNLTKQRFSFPSGLEVVPGEMVEVHSGISKEAIKEGLFWTEKAMWSGESEDVLLLNPAGRLVFWYILKH